MLAYYLHNLDPFVFKITDTIGPRWYGLAYVLGFVCGYLVLKKLAAKGYSQLKPDQVADFIVFAALFGVMLGGRLGYMLLYNRQEFFANPLSFFNILGGGMASHGGFLGLFLFVLIYGKIKNLSFAGLADDLVCVGPIGVFFGRIANFINGELYGRATQVAWAVQFPNELHDNPSLYYQTAQAAPGDYQDVNHLLYASKNNSAVADALRENLTPRHPSQLYEAFLEGALLFAFIMFIRLKYKNLRYGIIAGTFFILYALARIGVEFFREIDKGQSPILGLNPGQFYSFFMIALGIAFLLHARTHPRKT
ncbi:MAG: prolipoprotein diacylglyceryl transferase [Verrucomicrobiota bacterium]